MTEAFADDPSGPDSDPRLLACVWRGSGRVRWTPNPAAGVVAEPIRAVPVWASVLAMASSTSSLSARSSGSRLVTWMPQGTPISIANETTIAVATVKLTPGTNIVPSTQATTNVEGTIENVQQRSSQPDRVAERVVEQQPVADDGYLGTQGRHHGSSGHGRNRNDVLLVLSSLRPTGCMSSQQIGQARRSTRSLVIPDDVADPAVVKATGLVTLPARVRWSAPACSYDLTDRRQRARVYEQVLVEGGEQDVRELIDVDELIALSDELYLPDHVRRAWADRIAERRAIKLPC